MREPWMMMKDSGFRTPKPVKKALSVYSLKKISGYTKPKVSTPISDDGCEAERKGKSKGKGKRKPRPGFKPRSKGKGSAHYGEDQYPTGPPYDDPWQTDAYFGKKGKGGKKGGKPQKGKKGSYPYVPYNPYSGGKESFKGKGKDKNKGPPQIANVAQGSASGSQGQEQAQQPVQANQAAASSYEGPWEYEQDHWNDWYGGDSSGYYGYQQDEWYEWSYFVNGWTDGPPDDVKHDQTIAISCVSDATATGSDAGFHSRSRDTRNHSHSLQPTPVQINEALYNYDDEEPDQCLLCEYVDLKTHPTFVILDSGCTRAMGSRYAVDRLVRACSQHPKKHLIYFTTESCHGHFSFANGEQSHVTERLVIHLRSDQSATGWIQTTVDILDKGQVPILFSVEQMRNLRMNIEHTPVGEFLTCPLFGMNRTPLSVSTSNHPVLDIMSLATAGSKPNHSFASANTITCPACCGKKRAHTWDDRCAKGSAKSKPSESSSSKPAIPPSAGADGVPKTRKTRTFVNPDKMLSEAPGPQLNDGDYEPSIAPEPEVKAEPGEPRVEEKKEPMPSLTLPIALKRIHDKLQSPTELLKLHLKHYHMSTEQFKGRTSALKLPKEIYDKYDAIVKQCDTCQKSKIAPTRSKMSGIRSEVFGELTFVDHGEIKIDERSKLQFLMLFDGATSLTTAYVVTTRSDVETMSLILDYFETYQLNPKFIVGDQAFMSVDMEHFYNRHNIKPIALGPGTPWPNRAEAAIRTFKKQLSLMLAGLKEDPLLSNVTYRQVVRQAALARNSMVTFGGITPLELAFGRRPADLISVETSTPPQLTSEVPTTEHQLRALRQLAQHKYIEAKQSDDLRRDIAARLQFSDGPFYPGDKIYYWTEDKSKIKSDGSHSGKWIKGKIVSVDGSMVGIDLGTRILKVNISKIRKDHNPIEDVDVPLDPAGLTASGVDPAILIQEADANQTGPETYRYSDFTWQPVHRGKIDFLELFSGSARLSQVAAMNGLRVGQPIDLRTGYDILTSEGRAKCMKIIEEQRPEVVFMAPVCGPWSILQNINDWYKVEEKRKKYLPMIEFCVRVAKYQLAHGRHFIMENPQTSQMWYTQVIQYLLKNPTVGYDTLDMCAFGMRDPNGYYYYKPTSLLHSMGPDVLTPVFRRCPNKLGGAGHGHRTQHVHQPIEGHSPGHGSRTKLAQIYPYRFCSTLIRSLLPLGNVRGLYAVQLSLTTDLLDDCFRSPELHELQKIAASDTAPVFTTTSKANAIPVKQFHIRRTLTYINSLPVGYQYDPFQLELHHDLTVLRQRYFPQIPFENAVILRGLLSPLRLQLRHKQGVLLMWRKTDHTQIYLLQHPQTDLSQLIPKQWSAILFWNNSGEVPTPNNQPVPLANVAPPPGLDPDQPMPAPLNNEPQDDDQPAMPDVPMDNPPPDFPPQEDHPAPDHGQPPQPPVPPPAPHQPAQPQPAALAPVSPDTPVTPWAPPNAVIHPNVVVPPNIPDVPMQHSVKRTQPTTPHQSPNTSPPSTQAKTKARPSQMPATAFQPASGSKPSNHLGGDVPVSQSSRPKNPFGFKDDNPFGPLANDDEDEDDYRDPDAAPSGPPPLPVVGGNDERNTPAPRPRDPPKPIPIHTPKSVPQRPPSQPSQNSQDTVPYNDEDVEEEDDFDSDDTLDYNDLCIEENDWNLLATEQKICSNTGSFTVPRYMDGSPIPLNNVESSSNYVSSYAIRDTSRYRPNRRRNKSDILEEYHGLTDDDKSFLTLYQISDYGSMLVGKKRKEATQQEKRQLAKQFLEAKQAECKSWIDRCF